MILDTVTRGMKALLNGNEITIYERTVLESMLDQANRRGNLTEKQVRFYNSIASNYTENALMEKREWEAGFVDKKLDDLMIIARYYKAQGSYFLALVEKITIFLTRVSTISFVRTSTLKRFSRSTTRSPSLR